MKIKTDRLPRSIDYFTVDKEYEVIERDKDLVKVVDDEGEEMYCLISGCAHLQGRKWTVVEGE